MGCRVSCGACGSPVFREARAWSVLRLLWPGRYARFANGGWALRVAVRKPLCDFPAWSRVCLRL